MFLNLKGQTALVTGSTAGIGKAIAKSLVAEGVTVIINGRHEDKVHQTMQEIQQQYPEAVLQSLVSDLGTYQGCEKAIEEFPVIDILINNLGIFELKEILISLMKNRLKCLRST